MPKQLEFSFMGEEANKQVLYDYIRTIQADLDLTDEDVVDVLKHVLIEKTVEEVLT